ncbi:hypothetical protein L0156_14945 [bacterium]|nr:hypothetical protein [bacterium]
MQIEKEEDVALKAILEGTAHEYLPEKNHFRAIAFWLNGQMRRNYEMEIEGSPCEIVVRSAGENYFICPSSCSLKISDHRDLYHARSLLCFG